LFSDFYILSAPFEIYTYL